jgi:hypothetical protein
MIPTDEQFRQMGYTGKARDQVMDDMALHLFAAFNGVTVAQLPDTFRYHPNKWSQAAWSRVAQAAMEYQEQEQ